VSARRGGLRSVAVLLVLAFAAAGLYAFERRSDPARDGLLWKADAEAAMATEWASNSSIPAAASPPNPDPTRITQTTRRSQGARSFRFEMRDGDDSYGERAELAQAMPAIPRYSNRLFRAGEERWIALQYYFPSDWPSDNTWMTVFQIKPSQIDGGGPNIGIDAGNGKLKFYGNSNEWGSAAGEYSDGAGPFGGTYMLPRDRWIKLSFHVKFSADPAVGFVEIFGDLGDGLGMRTLAPRRTRATMKYYRGAMDPVHLRVGIYRDPAITATGTLFVDGVTVATNRAAAEANAFGPAT
jgi:hypothetical protein